VPAAFARRRNFVNGNAAPFVTALAPDSAPTARELVDPRSGTSSVAASFGGAGSGQPAAARHPGTSTSSTTSLQRRARRSIVWRAASDIRRRRTG
jgi:hypothetical protein